MLATGARGSRHGGGGHICHHGFGLSFFAVAAASEFGRTQMEVVRVQNAVDAAARGLSTATWGCDTPSAPRTSALMRARAAKMARGTVEVAVVIDTADRSTALAHPGSARVAAARAIAGRKLWRRC